MLTGAGDAADRLHRARMATTGNPIATGIVDRALPAVATVLDGAGCRYQWARTLVMMGGDHRRHGEAVMADMGATEMIRPQESRRRPA